VRSLMLKSVTVEQELADTTSSAASMRTFISGAWTARAEFVVSGEYNTMQVTGEELDMVIDQLRALLVQFDGSHE
jgi:hypothetical protein